ncbi:MAG: endospore germination permease [Defluviitaleaceae bacterium]|nr:endospore germination permease [Defluviitaleaceae bacterium]
MLSCNERITLRQMQLLIILSAMGTGMIVLPRRAAEYAAQDGWLIVLGLTAIAMLASALIIKAARIKPNAPFIANAGYALSRPVAKVLAVFLWIKLVLAAGLEMRSFLVITRQVLLRDTPIFIVSAVMLCVCAYAAIKGIETRARVAEVLVLLLAVPFIFLFVIALIDIDLSNLQPLFTAPPKRLLEGTLRLGFVFTGLECLLLVSPYIAPDKKAGRAAVTAVGLAGIIITALTVITLAKFGAGVTDEPWPVLRMMDMLSLPGSFIERQEALMFGFWIVTVFALVNALLFFGGRLLGEFGTKKKGIFSRRVCTVVTVLAVFAVTCMPWEGEGIYKRLDWLYYTSGVFFLLVLPVLMIIGAKLRDWLNRRGKHMADGTKSFLLFAVLFTPLLGLAGCYDRVEIEDRKFVVAFGIDKKESEGDENTSEERYKLSVYTNLSQNKDEGEADEHEEHIKTASGRTLTEAMSKLDTQANTRLYYGQAKIILLGEELTEDAALVTDAFAALVQNMEIERQIKVIVIDGMASEALGKDLHKKIARANTVNFSPDFEELHTRLKQSGCALIPKHPDGAIALKACGKTETLDAAGLRGFLWCLDGKNKGEVVTVSAENTAPNDGAFISFAINKHTAEITIEPRYPAPRVIVEVKAEGHIVKSGEVSPGFAAILIEREIANEIRATAEKLKDANLDAYQWLEYLRKKRYGLYQRYGYRWAEIFPQLEIVPRVSVTVR